MSIERIVAKINTIMNSKNLSADELKFTVLVFAVVTELDLDGLSRVVVNRW